MKDPTPARLKQLLSYDPETGILSWIVDRGPVKKGQAAGCIGNRGYMKVTVDRTYSLVHRIAWILHHDQSIPPGMQIDHRNNDKFDNRISNLRLASDTQNRHNRPVTRTNKAGFKGVSLHKASGLWVARIKKDRKIHELGYFKTPEEAHEAYKTAATRLHGEFARW